MRTRLRGKVTLLFIMVAALIAVPAIAAFADNVQNDVVAGGTDTITTSGSTTINYQVKNTAAGGSAFSGCDPADGSKLTLTINKPAAVTASPGSLTFDKCDTPQSVQFSSSTVGDYNITVSASDSHGNYNVSGAAFTLHVTNPPPPPNTAPTLSLPSNPTAEATGPGGAAVTYTATASDDQDGSLTPLCTPASDSTFPLGSTQVDCSVTDSGDLTTSGFFTVTVVDTTAPVIASHADVIAEATGPGGATVNYTPPATSDAVDGNGTADCSPAPGSFPLGDTTVTCNATDAAGNDATPTTFKVTVRDTTAPVIASHADVNATATSANGAVVTYTSPSTTDAVDGNGTATCTPTSGSQFALGSTTVSCSATDAHGNTGTSNFKVYVTASASDFLQPINADDSSIFKQGSTVPVKFQLTGDSAGITNLVANLRISKVSNNVLGDEVEAVTSTPASTGSLFRYDATSGQYIYNWGTKSYSAGTYQLRIDLGDGVGTRTVLVSLKK